MSWMKRIAPFAAVAVALTLIAAQSQQQAGSKARIGEQAPTFTLKDHNGEDVSLADHAGKIVVLEWFNEGCPVVVRHYKADTMNKTFAKYKDKDVVWLAINSTAGNKAEGNKKAADGWKMKHPILSDSDGKVGKMYGSKNTPTNGWKSLCGFSPTSIRRLLA